MSVGVDAEVIVVGAGPAGSSTARGLASQGVNVLLVDRDSFPRYKTCGGGIIGVTRSCVPPGMPIRDDIHNATFTLKGGKSRTRESLTPIMSTVVREEFDTWLLEEAVEAGATFLSGVSVRSFVANDEYATLELADKTRFTARYVVDASGTSSRIARQVGVDLKSIDLGLELELASDPTDDRWRSRIHLDWGPIPGSYGWVFPKGNSLTVGVIGAKGEPDGLRRYLSDFVRQVGLMDAEVLKDSGHLTRCRTHRSPVGGKRVLLAGDAAGLLEPWTREGLSYATRSGAMAAEALAMVIRRRAADEVALQIYRDQLESSLLPEMRAGFEALRAFERHPEIFHMLIADTAVGWKYFGRITSGDTTIARAMRHVVVRRSIGLLGRI